MRMTLHVIVGAAKQSHRVWPSDQPKASIQWYRPLFQILAGNFTAEFLRQPASRSCQNTGFLERQARRADEGAGRVARAQVDQEIRPPSALAEECRVYRGVVEAGHRPDVQPQRAGGDHQIGTLQRAVAK